ncbi:Eukaryotic translation initiation factor 2 subunit 2 isoform 4 [Schistosoma japonicum]|uniref:Eukaryotic translation initiation factor 2 subunit 2 n=2 Tax=Schistosoma japonicum TaxID=6182 RepID=A0A4Z2DJL9_SCHJA|nr:Eukaryotic translation initiation factor 2 subunit 2 isoform 4 [Schistosoma japonicum]
MVNTLLQDDILDFESKKKKKAKPLVQDIKGEVDDLENPDVLDFGSKKKKKDKSYSLDVMKTKEDESETLKSSSENGVKELTERLTDELQFSDKKKKRKFKPIEVNENEAHEPDSAPELVVKDSSGYDYEMLLTRVFTQLGDLNPELVSDQKRKLVMVPPQMARVGTKKTLFVNFSTICRSLSREQSHLTTYILTELGTQGSVDANGALLIRGRYTSKHMEPVLRNYCRTYVLCGTCQSSETDLCKDSRLLFLQCRRCGSRFTVKTVTSGFQALTGKRAALRAKTQ